MYIGEEERKKLEEVREKLSRAGIRIDDEKHIIRKGREYVYFSSQANMERMLFLIHEAFMNASAT